MPQQLELDGIQFDWPVEPKFPKDYGELEKKYGAFVAVQVNRHNKVGRNVQDILQEIWSKLCSSRFLEKFLLSAAKRYPVHMTGEEACAYLGINFHTWLWFHGQFRKNPEEAPLWMPSPVEGGIYSKKALYYTEDIFILEEIRDEIGRSMKPVRARKRPLLSIHGFKAYLARSIHNYFANWCRGQDRHYKESLLAPSTFLKKLSNGEYKCRSSYSDDPPAAWEDSLPDQVEVSQEDLIDAASWMNKKGIDPQSDLGIRVIELISRGFAIDQIEKCKALKLHKLRVRAVV